jgi:hypothetical protein
LFNNYRLGIVHTTTDGLNGVSVKNVYEVRDQGDELT